MRSRKTCLKMFKNVHYHGIANCMTSLKPCRYTHYQCLHTRLLC